MLRRLLCTPALVVALWVGGIPGAEASCAGSVVLIAVRPSVFGEAIPVTWQIDPPCDVIESGLLLGSHPTTLSPVGQPIYGPRTIYQQEIPVAESGEYYVAGYARDEAGDSIQSPLQLVVVAVPPPPLPGPHGSHGAPPFYTGTDEDFLRPAGQPHYSALRKGTSTQTGVWNARTPYWFGDTMRVGSSTRRDEVLAQQDEVVLNGISVPIAPAAVAVALDGLDQVTFAGYPRLGLYVVACRASTDPWGGIVTSCTPSYNPSFPTLGVFFEDTLWGSFSGSADSRVTYFIPRPPAGKQVGNARLRAYASVTRGDYSGFRLNGKAPTAIEVVFCSPAPNCTLWVTWDFTEEARALAAQGGGTLELIPDPIPPTVLGPDFRSASYVLWLNVDYPWRHGAGGVGDLRVTFEEECAKGLELEVDPTSIRPELPAVSTIPAFLRSVLSRATVTARVKSCPPESGAPPASVEVTFEVLGPASGTPEAGGHARGHAEPRPERAWGSFDRPNGPKRSHCTVRTFDAQGMGSCEVPVTYHPSEVNGNEKITAQATGFPDARKDVMVEVPSLQNLAAIQANFFRLVGQTATHPDNHWGTPSTVRNIQLVALDFADLTCDEPGNCSILRINDLSLRWGGLFDICGTWNPADTCPPLTSPDRGGHFWHRTGTSVDIGRTACRGLIPEGASALTDCPPSERVSIPRRVIADICFGRDRATMVPEANYHCEWDQ